MVFDGQEQISTLLVEPGFLTVPKTSRLGTVSGMLPVSAGPASPGRALLADRARLSTDGRRSSILEATACGDVAGGRLASLQPTRKHHQFLTLRRTARRSWGVCLTFSPRHGDRCHTPGTGADELMELSILRIRYGPNWPSARNGTGRRNNRSYLCRTASPVHRRTRAILESSESLAGATAVRAASLAVARAEAPRLSHSPRRPHLARPRNAGPGRCPNDP